MTNRIYRASASAAVAAIALSIGFAAHAQKNDEAKWPRKLDTDHGALTIYQPQPERFDGNIIEGRAAASLRFRATSEPTFGVFWFKARVDTDREADTAVLRDIEITNVRWPDSQATDEADVRAFLTSLMPKTSVPMSLAQLRASLATAEAEQSSLVGLKHDPPQIVVVEEISVLLLYDGEPRALPIPNSDFEHVANAALAVVHDKRNGTYYLNGGQFWYSAPDAKGPWTSIATPPAEVSTLLPAAEVAAEAPLLDTPPEIVVATEPTELIVSDGAPNWQSLADGKLLYVANSESKVVREVATNAVFVLISGRWYRAPTLEGPWTVVRPDQLPAAFKDIAPASALGGARVSVAGTPEAEDAALDAVVPQTAAIDRNKATLEVTYDGEPAFKQIDGTKVEYATNTSAQVLRIDRKYYACDEGVWFVADEAAGPWSVATSIPNEEIDKIPPSEPVYNLKYVEVYESTEEVVYVGYTPGYMWSYPWYGVPIYGTGWYYPPYWGRCCYYPSPHTWGLHVSYNPWTGWGMGVSHTFGFITVGIIFGGGYGGYYRPGYPPFYYRPPYYPPGGYRPPYYPGYPGYRPGYGPRPTPYRPTAGQLPAGGAGRGTAGQLPAGAGAITPGQLTTGASNLYKGAAGQNRVATSDRGSGVTTMDRAARGGNNVYADPSGNVHRETPQGWESRGNGQWETPSTRQTPSSIDRDYGARQSGASRSPAPRPSYGGGGFRGGGFRGGGRR